MHRSSHHEYLVAETLTLAARLVVAQDDLHDYVRFWAVCTHVWSSLLSPCANRIVVPRFHPRWWTMLPKGHELHLEDGRMHFLNIDTGVFVCPRAPLLEDRRVLCPVEGLLLLQRHQQHDNKNRDDVCLLHPFTGSVAKFLQSHMPQ
ncbi:hypothetical protein VPH35_016799 [Triticum aestivum]|uniref:Uncharacterized protein n=1 Tax=Aegilops tauschii TaxID=37682 RepID=M8CM94_AEGTA